MPDERTNRRLAAILAADVVGYSKMMAADEAGTLTSLKKHRETEFNPAVERHHGRVVKLIGDGTLVEFASVVDAVKCALEIQLQAAQRADTDSEIKLRIGVNLGDIIIEGDDIYGDGVNIAARLEPLAEPGGVCVASIVNESVGTRIDVKFEDGGEVQVKNIERPIRIWKWRPSAQAPRPRAVTDGEDGNGAVRASIAVLPFDNMSGDPEQEYFSDGITEDLITDLSKVGGLTVIARNSSFAYKGKSPDIRVVGRELGVNSVLEGSIRRAGNRVRITAQLIEAASGSHLWAERYDRDLTDIFEVQDEVTRKIVDALKVKLAPGEKERIKDGGTKSIEAHDLFLKGRELVIGPTKNAEVFEQMKSLFGQAIALDANYAEPVAGLAYAWLYDYQNSWSADAENSLEKSLALARKAAALDPNDPFAQHVRGIAEGISNNFEEAFEATRKTLELNPNYAQGHNALGAYEIFNGDPEKAIPHVEKAIQLDPKAAHQYLHFLGLAHLLMGHFETAAAIYRERIAQVPDTDISRSMLTSTLGYLGEVEEAKRVWAELMRINPNYSFERHMTRVPFQSAERVGFLRDGLKKAGVIG